MSSTKNNSPNCYCDLWDKSPKTLEKQGVPRGYCGLCDICGKPGHIRHFPGAVPFTGTWCAKHYRRKRLYDPRGSVGCFVWLFGFLLSIVGAITYWKLYLDFK